jgi:hypothetical protein
VLLDDPIAEGFGGGAYCSKSSISTIKSRSMPFRKSSAEERWRDDGENENPYSGATIYGGCSAPHSSSMYWPTEVSVIEAAPVSDPEQGMCRRIGPRINGSESRHPSPVRVTREA